MIFIEIFVGLALILLLCLGGCASKRSEKDPPETRHLWAEAKTEEVERGDDSDAK